MLRNCQESDLYESMLKNFSEIVSFFPSIPWFLILEVILQKQTSSTITEIELSLFLNFLDHENIDTKHSLMIYDIISKIFLETYYLSGLTIQIMIKIIDKFKEEHIIE